MEEQLKIDFEKKLKDFSYSDQEKKFKETNFKEFLKQGFPNRKLENWKFSDLNFIISKNFKQITNNDDLKFDKKIKLIDDFEHNYILLVNGIFKSCDLKYEDKEKLKVISLKSLENLSLPNNNLYYLRT